MADQDNADPALQTAEPGEALTRRRALTAVGLLAAGSGVTAQAASSNTAPQATGSAVADAAPPANAVEFRARFVQSGGFGEAFVAYGYLTKVQDLGDADLFAGTVHNETTALFTAYASGNLAQRTLDRSVHSLDIEGSLTVYRRDFPGASFTDPNSFQVGTPVARFDLALQDILTVFLPNRGIPTLTGAIRQTLAEKLAGAHPNRRFGRVGSSARLFATGVGDLVDPVTLNAVLEMAGNWVVE
ncbi:MAG: hypothetical protein ACJ8G7_00360 [Rhizobacter sp.]